MHTQQDSMWAPIDLLVLNWHTYNTPSIPPRLPFAAWSRLGWLGGNGRSTWSLWHHGPVLFPSRWDQRRSTGPLHINWNRCSERGLFFFIGSSGNHKANILQEDGFRGALWANWEGKWINERPSGTVNQQAKRRAECTVEAPGAQPKARASVSQSLVLMSKPAGPGSTCL